MSTRYNIEFSAEAVRAIEFGLPEKVAAAVIEFIYGPLAEQPRRVGKALREPLEPYWVARRGEYRVMYEIIDHRVVVQVVSVNHRRDAYR